MEDRWRREDEKERNEMNQITEERKSIIYKYKYVCIIRIIYT